MVVLLLVLSLLLSRPCPCLLLQLPPRAYLLLMQMGDYFAYSAPQEFVVIRATRAT